MDEMESGCRGRKRRRDRGNREKKDHSSGAWHNTKRY